MGESFADDAAEDEFFPNGRDDSEQQEDDGETGAVAEEAGDVHGLHLVEAFDVNFAGELFPGITGPEIDLRTEGGEGENQEEGLHPVDGADAGEAGPVAGQGDASAGGDDDEEEAEELFSAEPGDEPRFEEVGLHHINDGEGAVVDGADEVEEEHTHHESGDVVGEGDAPEPEEGFSEAGA